MPIASRITPFLLLPLVSAALHAQAVFRLGVNLDAAGAFVNIVNHTNRYSNAAGYDSLGWPTSDFDLVLMDGRPVAEWIGAIDDPDQYRVDFSGRYACAFTGAGTVRATGTSVTVENAAYDAASNTSTFDLVVGGYPNANHGLVFLNVSNTRRTPGDTLHSGITQLRVHRPGYPLSTAKVFTDEYLALCRAADFACYRFYNVQNVWDGEPAWPRATPWERRKTPRDAAQTSMASLNGKLDGWCWEYIVALANTLGRDIWICLHQSCDSNYVAALASYMRTSLDPGIAIYVENSNEVWSPTQTTHGPYNNADAQARGITFDQNYARRTVELSRWFAAVFGQEQINRRIRVILAGQQAYPGRSDNHLSFINSRFGPPGNFLYATSTALYFGSANAASADTAAIIAGMLQEIDGQIANAQTAGYRPVHIAKAAQWNLPGGCTSYEGGPHLPAGGGTTNLAAQIDAHRTVAMGDVLRHNWLEGWRDLGGSLALAFTLVSGYNRYGCWGLTDDVTKPDRNAKMQAARDIIRASTTNASHAPPSGGPDLAIYPNPFRQFLVLRPAATTRIAITDILGRAVWQGEVEHVSIINTRMWKPGIYYVVYSSQRPSVILKNGL